VTPEVTDRRTATAATRTSSSRLRHRATLAVVLGALILAVLRSGVLRRPPRGLPDAGLLTAWCLPASRLAADLAGAVTIGSLIAATVLLPSEATLDATRARAVAARAGVLWAGSVLIQLAFTQSDILGMPLGRALRTDFRHYLSVFPQEQALAAQCALALGTVLLTTRFTPAATVLAMTTLLPPLATGHSGTASHAVAVPSLIVHVVSVTVWTGGLLAMARLARTDSDHLVPAVERFSTLALCCFIAAAASGVTNAVLRLGRPGDLATTPYGQLVAAKSACLIILCACGWWHRRAMLPRLAEPAGRRAFLRLAGAEAALMLVTFAIAVGLARTATPAS